MAVHLLRIQAVVARALAERGLAVCLSFGEINGPVTTIGSDTPFRVFRGFDPIKIRTLPSAIKLIRDLRRHRIRYAYLTDMPTWHWVYPLMRLAGVKRIVSHSHVSDYCRDPIQCRKSAVSAGWPRG